MDIEREALAESHLLNTTVRNFAWRGVTVTVKDRETKQPKTIVDMCDGVVEAGMYRQSRIDSIHSLPAEF